MSNWRITKINNATHEVECKHPSGEKLSFTVPLDQVSSELKMLYIKAQCEAKDVELAIKAEALKVEAALQAKMLQWKHDSRCLSVEAALQAKMSFFKSVRFYQILCAVEAIALLTLYFLR